MPDILPMSPELDPATDDCGARLFGGDREWMFKFAAAVRRAWGSRSLRPRESRLAPNDATPFAFGAPLERLVVLGVDWTLGAESAADALENCSRATPRARAWPSCRSARPPTTPVVVPRRSTAASSRRRPPRPSPRRQPGRPMPTTCCGVPSASGPGAAAGHGAGRGAGRAAHADAHDQCAVARHLRALSRRAVERVHRRHRIRHRPRHRRRAQLRRRLGAPGRAAAAAAHRQAALRRAAGGAPATSRRARTRTASPRCWACCARRGARPWPPCRASTAASLDDVRELIQSGPWSAGEPVPQHGEPEQVGHGQRHLRAVRCGADRRQDADRLKSSGLRRAAAGAGADADRGARRAGPRPRLRALGAGRPEGQERARAPHEPLDPPLHRADPRRAGQRNQAKALLSKHQNGDSLLEACSPSRPRRSSTRRACTRRQGAGRERARPGLFEPGVRRARSPPS